MNKDTRARAHLTTYVSATPLRRDLPAVQMSTPAIVDLLPHASHSTHSRQDDDAMTHAKAALLVSAAYIVAAGMITFGLLLIAWLFRALGDAWGAYVYGGLIGWGLCVLWALWANRRQSLHHSPSGIAHHELDSREKIALHAIDTHAELLIKRWKLDRHDK